MPWPRSWAEFNQRSINPVVLRFIAVSPLHGILEHRGRKSGRTYRIPLVVLHTADGFAMVPGYGLNSDWVLNLQAAGGGGLRHRGKDYVLSNPRVLEGEEAKDAIPMTVMRIAAKRWDWDGLVRVDARRAAP
jgi:deazaflavin-dependent oxidoreductase (nitroreductase family)